MVGMTRALARSRGSARLEHYGKALHAYGPPAALVGAGVVVWETVLRLLDVETFLFPTPSTVAEALASDRDLLAEHTLVTLREVVFGFAIAIAAGVIVAVLLHLSTVIRRSLYPLLLASQTIPVIVLAPVLVILLGFGIWPKLAIVALICFFPVVISGIDGLRAVDPALITLMRTLHGSRWAILWRVELPSALPAFFSGTRIAATYAAIGAVFGEWSGAQSGLGFLILQSSSTLDTPRTFAAIVVLTIIALGLVGFVFVIERLAVPWVREGS